MSTITKTFRVDGVLTNMTSVVLSDITASFGIKRNDTDAVVVADGTAMTNSSTGVYTHTFTDPANDLTYTYSLEYVFSGETYHVEDTLIGPTTTTDLTSTTNVKSYLGITSSDNDTLIGNLVTRVSREIETYCQRTFNSTAYVMERYQPTDDQTIYIRNYPLISLARVAVGRRGLLEITHSDTSAASATVSVSTTGITTTILGGGNAGSNTEAFGTYTTLSALATQITTRTDWTATVPDSSFDNVASTDLIPVGARETLDGTITMDVPDERVSDYQVDFEQGSIYRPSGFRGRWNDIYIDYTGGYATIPDDLEQIAIEITAEVYQSRTINNAVKSEKIGDYKYENADNKENGIRPVILGHSGDLAMWRRPVYA